MRQFPQAQGDQTVPDREHWNKELLNSITAIQAKLVGRIRAGPLFEDLLAALLKLSESEYGFIGETRPYIKRNGTFGGIPLSRPVPLGGKGSWELAARWSSLDLNDGLIEGGEVDIFSLGVTWWMSGIFGMSLNYRYIWNEREGVNGESNAISLRLMMVLM